MKTMNTQLSVIFIIALSTSGEGYIKAELGKTDFKVKEVLKGMFGACPQITT